MEILQGAGYEPDVDATDGTVTLRNCPFDALVAGHRELTCGMNLAWAQGVVEGLGDPTATVLAPRPGRCCVLVHDARRDGAPSTAGEPETTGI